MIDLNPFALSGIFIALTSFPLFIFILLRGKKWVAKIYALNILTIALWGVGAFFIAICKDPKIAIFLWKISYVSVIFIPVFLLHAVSIITKNKSLLLVRIVYVLSILIVCLNLNDQLFTSSYYIFDIYFLKGNFLYLLSFIFWEALVVWAHLKLFIYYKKSFPKERKQIACLILASIGFLGGSMNFLPNLGIHIYPYGNFIAPLYCVMVTYVIYKHQLLDIEIAYKKALSYSILFTTTTLLYLLIVLSSEKLIQHYWKYNSPTISIITAFFIGILFIPLRNRIQEITDRYFFNTTHIQMINENVLLRQSAAQTDKLKTIATFASGMAHEIKNPLTSLKTFVEYLPKKIDDKDFINKFVPIVTKEVDRINDLVNDLLEYARPSPLMLKTSNPNKSINDTLDILNSQLIEKKITAVREFDENESTKLLLDQKQIKQAFLNIFINAIDALHSGGSIRITTTYSKNKFIMNITDTGCGIAKEDMPYIFDPFFTKKENGTGLGLSITHGIIQEHGGKIFVESEVGRGTTFRIELPIKEEY